MFAHSVEITYHIIDDSPFVQRVVLDGVGSQFGYQLLVFEMLQRETITHIRTRIVAVEIGYHARFHFNLDIAGIFYLFISDILILEVNTCNICRRNNERAQYKTGYRNNPRRNSIRQHKPPETHAAGKHRNNLRIVCQLRGKEDNRNKREQRTEQVGKVRDKVHVIIQDNGL